MKKQLSKIALGLSLFAFSSGSAQQPQILPCHTYEAMEEIFATDPAARKNYDENQKKFQAEYLQNLANANGKSAAAAAYEYTIPVVFHILHTGGPENISDQVCIDALDWVNKDLARLHADANTVAQPFQSLYVPSDIKLMLAKRDNAGNCVTGIVHRYDTRTVWDRSGNINLLYSGITAMYPSSRYLNIIIVKEIVAQPNQVGTIVGYTYKPGTWGSNVAQDAIVYNYSYLDVNGGEPRSLTHELGHWLNLSHTWGDTNNPGISCGDDFVSDTPPTRGQLGGCPSSASGNLCATTSNTAYTAGMNNSENIMDYTSCSKNFTAGQTERMRTALASSISSRNNLSSPGNIAFTDVNGAGVCAPVAEFISTTLGYTVCSGGSLTMRDFSYNGSVDNYNWAAGNGGIVASPTSSSTSIQFNTIGTVNVTLTVSNAQGATSKVRTVTVVDGTASMVGPYTEGFESSLQPDWSTFNSTNNSPTWEYTYDASYEGNACFVLQNAGAFANDVDYLQTPIIDMSASPVKDLEFAYAYARKNTSETDIFRVESSTDCGGSWNDLLVYTAGQMAGFSGGTTASSFIPTPEQWRSVVLSSAAFSKWNAIKNSPALIIRFTFEQGNTGAGNNFYLDAINLPAGGTGLAELRSKLGLSLYPNPTNGSASLSLHLHDASKVRVAVLDVLGKEVLPVTETNLSAGEQTLTLNANSSLPAGIYFVDIMVNGSRVTEKLVID